MQYKYIVAVIAVFGLFMELLDSTIVNVAIPTLAKDFDATPTTIEWVVTGYLLSLAVFIPVSGWAGDRFGTKRMFIIATTVFTSASALCAAAWSIETLILFRVFQGMGAGMLTPLGMAMLFRAFPPEERSKASGFTVVPTTVAPASGPVLGGLLIEYLSWEWIFLVNVPIGIAAIVVSSKYLKEHREPRPGRFDPYGFLLAGAGLGALLYGLAEAGFNGFGDTRVILFLIAGVALLAAFVVVELRVPEPMIDVRLFGDRLFRACNIAQFIAFLGFAGALYLLPIMLQAERGLSPLQSGLTTFPQALGVMALAQPASRIYHRFGPRRLIALGLLISTITTTGLALTDLETDQWVIRGIMFVRGTGFGLMLVPMQAATFATIASKDTGRASSLFSSSRMVAQSVGVAILATVFANRLTHYGAHLGVGAPAPIRDGAVSAFQEGFMAAAALTVIGMVAALVLIRDSDAAPSMRPRRAVAHDEEPAAATAH